MTRIVLVTALFGALAFSACGPGTGADAGPSDDAGEGEGEGEGEDQCRAEAQSCGVDDDECCEGLTCVPGALNPTRGTCRLECGELTPNGGATKDDPSPCADGRTCQVLITVTPEGALEPEGVVCLDQQDDRDALCEALADPEACADGRSCEVVDAVRGADGSISFDLGCKDVCEFGTEGADDQCTDGEVCFPSPLPVVPQEIQLTDENDPNSTVTCNATACAAGEDCACDVANGFECLDLEAQDLCVRFAGQCGIPVPFVTASDLTGTPGNDIFCNAVDDHRYCDDRLYRDLDNPAQVLCLPIQQGSNEGLCIAACSQEAFDYNGDGSVGAGEQAQDWNCPETTECDLDFSEDIGLGVVLTESNGDDETCDPTECPAGAACASCSNPEARCLEPQTGDAICILLFGTCQPPDAPSDAGPEPDDAGSTDAGTADAGTADAGTADAGAADAGDADAGEETDGGLLPDAGLTLDAGV